MCLGIPGRILDMRDDMGLAVGTIDFGGVRREACLAYVADEVGVGDYVIVHVGFAISKVDEDEARRTFQALQEMSQLDELDWMKEVADRSLAGMDGASPAGAVGPRPAAPTSGTAGASSAPADGAPA
jgi:hydrogenase expression/formation protein HypC